MAEDWVWPVGCLKGRCLVWGQTQAGSSNGIVQVGALRPSVSDREITNSTLGPGIAINQRGQRKRKNLTQRRHDQEPNELDSLPLVDGRPSINTDRRNPSRRSQAAGSSRQCGDADYA